MPSIGLYPPEIENNIPVFQTEEKNISINNINKTINAGIFNLYFNLSQFNSIDKYNVIQFTINYQKGGASAASKKNNINNEVHRYRNGNSIILTNINSISSNGFFTISEDDLIDNNWQLGELYKIQMRIGKVDESSFVDIQDNQENWINEHNKEFSEWSTISIIKPIGKITLMINPFEYNSDIVNTSLNSKTIKTILGTALDFNGIYSINSPLYTENLYSYTVSLYEISESEKLIEDSGIIYANSYNNLNRFRYVFHQELEQGKTYKVIFNYRTENGFVPKSPIELFFKCESSEGFSTIRDTLSIITPDLVNVYKSTLDDIFNTTDENNNIISSFPYNNFTIDKDNEEGRISIKLIVKNEQKPYSGNLILVRSDNRSNYTHWEDIKIINVVQQNINDLDIIYDYTVERFDNCVTVFLNKKFNK